MKQLKTVLLCLFFIGINPTTNAQFWKKIKKKLQDKVEKKVEQKIDKETDKVIDDTLNGKKQSEEPKVKQSIEFPKFNGGEAILKFYEYGYEYITEDIAISVYGKFTKENIANSVKTYNQDKIIAPVDAYPEGYALAYNGSGFLNTKNGQIIIHHADAKKIVFSLKGTWSTTDGNKPITASYVNLNVSDIFDKKSQKINSENKKNTSVRTENDAFSLDTAANPEGDTSIPNTFLFTSSLEIQLTSNDGSSTTMEYLLGRYKNIYGIALATEMGAEGKMYNVITPKNITMFMDMGIMKMKKTVSQDQNAQADFSDKVPTNPNDLQKTGASKSILGYTCYEYKHNHKEGFTSIWATKDFPMGRKNIGMLGMFEESTIDGFVLEIDMESKNEKINMKAIQFNQNKQTTINTTEYKSMGF